MHLGVLGGQALVGPAEALGGEHHPVTQTGELGEQLPRTGGEDHVVAAETHFLFGSDRVRATRTTDGGGPAPSGVLVRFSRHNTKEPDQTEGGLPVHEHDHKLRLLRVFEQLLLQPPDLLPAPHRPSHVSTAPVLPQTQNLYRTAISRTSVSHESSIAHQRACARARYLDCVVELSGRPHEAPEAVRLLGRCGDDQQVLCRRSADQRSITRTGSIKGS